MGNEPPSACLLTAADSLLSACPMLNFLVLNDQLNNSTDDESILVGSRLLSNAFLAGC